MGNKNEFRDFDNLKEKATHGNILFHLAVYQTQHKIPMEIMLNTHWHEELEILYINKGSMLLQIDSETVIVGEGDIIIIPPNFIHGALCHNHSPCEFNAIVFHPLFISSAIQDRIQQDYIDTFFIDRGKKYYIINENTKTNSIIRDNIFSIMEAYKAKGFGYELLLKSNILMILYQLVKSNADYKNEFTGEDYLTTSRIKEILDFLEVNYQNNFSLKDWASCIHISKEQFCRIFKKYFHKTPMSYLMHYRISKAADLLIHTTLPIIDIAFETGFESANYFTIAFKNITKVTPREYRNTHRI